MSESILTNRNGVLIYQETWTPTIEKSDDSKTLPTYETMQVNGLYSRIGRICYVSCWFYIKVTAAGTSDICIGSLPYISKNDSSDKYQVLSTGSLDATVHTRYGSALLFDNTNKVIIYKHNRNQPQTYTTNSETEISFSGCYLINSSYS